jgi:tRNA dimethylallyltransferase
VQNRLLAIVGPTSVGKSALALKLAKELLGEIVSADSRQVYRFMDIGTAKPSLEDRSAVPHHLIDVVNPDEDYSLALFLRHAAEAIQNAKNRSMVPILVGGTGQYVWGLLEGWQAPEVPPDHQLRRRLEERARTAGAASLYEELARLDPEAARHVDARNPRRVIRALEVYHGSPDHRSRSRRKAPPPYQTKIIGLSLERTALYQRIDHRVDMMIESGWIEEVRALLDRGYSPELPSLSSLGYGELVQHLDHEMSLDEAVQRIKYRTHRFARQQQAWFRTTDRRIRWFDASSLDQAEAEVARWLTGSQSPPCECGTP